MSEFKQDFLTANSKVSHLQESLGQVSEELDSIKGRMDEIGNGMTDSKPLINIKSAVLQLKSEIKTMDLRIGVMEHSLMQNKLTKPHLLFA
jgi:estrogen-related receptor beta like 1